MSRQLFEYHPVYGYRFIPNLKVRVSHRSGGYLVRTNAQGFRCRHDFVRARSPGKRRVLLFGDSYTAGDGVSNGKRYGDFLERMVPGLEVFNFGLPGTGTDQQYLAYREEAGGIEHDLLIVAVLVENIRRVVARYRQFVDDQGRTQLLAKPFFTLERGQLTLRGVPPAKEPKQPDEVDADEVDFGGRFPRLRGVVKRLGLKGLAQGVTRYQPLPDYDSPSSPAWLLMKAILSTWIDGHAEPVLLFPVPLYQYVEETSDPGPYLTRFEELAAEASCPWHSPLADLRAYDRDTRRSFRLDSDVHPSEAGHEALARSLAPMLEGLLPAVGDD